MKKIHNNDNTQVAINVLQKRFGDDKVQTNKSVREQHAHNLTWIEPQPPDAVMFAESAEEVSEVVRVCATHKLPIIPFGTGTSLEGGVNAPNGGIAINMMKMNKVIKVNQEDMDVVIESGVTREELNHELRHTGLFFPIDPGANASLGGMAATRASGTNAVRYGTMKDNIVNLTAVMPNGKIIKTGGRAKKSSAGYDLTRLIVGSEGTLGIITELTLKLYPVPEHIEAGRLQFPSVEDACNATIAAIASGIPMARIELLDELMTVIINEYSGLNLKKKATLFVEFHGTKTHVQEQVRMFTEIASELGGSDIEFASTTEQRSQLWKARHEAFFAMLAHRPGSKGIATDACVPISRLAECVTETIKDVKEFGLVAPIIGHVGDGNFHLSPLVMMDDEDEVRRAEEIIKRLNQRAINMDGTCTGEHGIGQGKREYLKMEHGEGVSVMYAIKKALDPNNIMNPTKIFVGDDRGGDD